MYIIIIGGGRVGYYLSRTLLSEGHEVLILEKDAQRCARITEELGSICVEADGCETASLEMAGTARADMLIAVTEQDEDNLVSCQLAKYKFKVPRTIARVSNPKDEMVFKKLGVDVVVSATSLILEHIEEEVPTHPICHLYSLGDGQRNIVEIKIAAESAAAGRTLNDIPLPPESIVIAVINENKTFKVAEKDVVIQPGDRLIVLSKTEHELDLRKAFIGE